MKSNADKVSDGWVLLQKPGRYIGPSEKVAFRIMPSKVDPYNKGLVVTVAAPSREGNVYYQSILDVSPEWAQRMEEWQK